MAAAADGTSLDRQRLVEQRDFAEYLACLYDPALWISHNQRLYFAPHIEAQRRQIEAMDAARTRYVAFTNREARYQFTAKALAESGLDPDWQKKMLLPYSPTNLYWVPVQDKPVEVADQYSICGPPLAGGVMIQAGDSIGFVVGFGRGADDFHSTNALLVREGMRYYTETNEHKSVAAYSDVALTALETTALAPRHGDIPREGGRPGAGNRRLPSSEQAAAPFPRPRASRPRPAGRRPRPGPRRTLSG